MDPYLEGSTWMNFHGQLCAEIARQLSPKLRPRYLARLTERFFTDLHFAIEIRDVHERRSTTARRFLAPVFAPNARPVRPWARLSPSKSTARAASK
jgi:hypothetical protein